MRCSCIKELRVILFRGYNVSGVDWLDFIVYVVLCRKHVILLVLRRRTLSEQILTITTQVTSSLVSQCIVCTHEHHLITGHQ